jgi:hypothetical protein
MASKREPEKASDLTFLSYDLRPETFAFFIMIQRLLYSEGNCFELSVGNERVRQAYWDFASFLSEVSITLDLLARIVGPPRILQRSSVSHRNSPRLFRIPDLDEYIQTHSIPGGR